MGKAECVYVQSEISIPVGGLDRAWARGKKDTQLALTVLDKARELRSELPEQVVLHADRGMLFTSHLLLEAKMSWGAVSG